MATYTPWASYKSRSTYINALWANLTLLLPFLLLILPNKPQLLTRLGRIGAEKAT